MGYKYTEYSIKYSVLIIILGILSFILNLLVRDDSATIYFEFIVLIAFVLIGSIYLVKIPIIKIEKVNILTENLSGVEEITNHIDNILNNLIEINNNSNARGSLNNIIADLKEISIKIRQSPNIYSVKIGAITKDMDEQDKLFIEQACFESHTQSFEINPKPMEYTKEYEINYGISELMGVLKNIGTEWNFNTFFISDCSGSTSLQVIGIYSMKRYGLDETFNISSAILERFFLELEEKYEKNPYHNSVHAADVMCSLIYLINSSMLVDHVTSLELLVCIISALAHDVGHPGKNNRFLVMSKNDIAVLYNDISVLEMMHASLLFQILKINNCNIFLHLSSEKWLISRRDIIDMILATDMGKHFELLGQFKAKYLNIDLHDLSLNEIRLDLFKLMIKAADIGHAAKNIELHERWCNLVIQEFYEQGDLEKSLGIPISMYCDRDNTDISKSQAGFIKNIVHPLYVSLNLVLTSQQIEENCIQQLKLNQKFWEFKRKGSRGQSLIAKTDKSSERTSFLPRIKNRKGSLPDKY